MASRPTTNPLAKAKMAMLALLAISTLILRTQPSGPYYYAVLGSTFSLVVLFAAIHGVQRYGVRTMLIWFLMAWGVSNAFEALSIRTGFPFGYYHYTPGGPRILDVPLGIMPIYFGISYLSWTVAQAVTGQFDRPIKGWFTLIIPVITALVMTMWDLVTDPQASTIAHTWIWRDGGLYFGVPISNFAGWVMVVYIFMQMFALLVRGRQEEGVTRHRSYWVEAISAYLIMGLGIVLEGFTRDTNVAIHQSMAMVAIFTMVFVGAIALMNVQREGWRG